MPENLPDKLASSTSEAHRTKNSRSKREERDLIAQYEKYDKKATSVDYDSATNLSGCWDENFYGCLIVGSFVVSFCLLKNVFPNNLLPVIILCLPFGFIIFVVSWISTMFVVAQCCRVWELLRRYIRR